MAIESQNGPGVIILVRASENLSSNDAVIKTHNNILVENVTWLVYCQNTYKRSNVSSEGPSLESSHFSLLYK